MSTDADRSMTTAGTLPGGFPYVCTLFRQGRNPSDEAAPVKKWGGMSVRVVGVVVLAVVSGGSIGGCGTDGGGGVVAGVSGEVSQGSLTHKMPKFTCGLLQRRTTWLNP